jgi:hypothetical protein
MRNEPFEIISKGEYTAEIWVEEEQEYPFCDFDSCSILVYESKRQTLRSDDVYRDNPLLYILYETDENIARRVEDAINWRQRKVHWLCYGNLDTPKSRQDRIWNEFCLWEERLMKNRLDKAGVAYMEFSLAGRETHTGWAYIPIQNMKGFKDVAEARKAIEEDIKTLNHWIEGEVYRFVSKKNGEKVDGCGRFYGLEPVQSAAKFELDANLANGVATQPALKVAREFGMILPLYYKSTYNILEGAT